MYRQKSTGNSWFSLIFSLKCILYVKFNGVIVHVRMRGPRNGSAAMEILTKSNCCYICVQGHHCNRWTDLPWNIPCLWIPVLYLSHRFLGTVFKLISQQWNRADLLRYFVLGKLPDFFHCCDNNVPSGVSGVIHSRYIGELSRQIWIRYNSFLKNRKNSARHSL